MVHVIPNAGIVWIQPCCQTQARRNTYRRCGNTIGKSDSFVGDSIQVWGLHPIRCGNRLNRHLVYIVTATPHCIPTLLICHEKENIRFHIFFVSLIFQWIETLVETVVLCEVS